MKQIPYSFFDGVKLVERLDAESLSAIPDENLEETVVFSMINADRAAYDGSALSLTSFARPWRQVVAVWQLWGELVNGGMHQYFYNSEGVDADLVCDGLLAMGCDELAGIFADATKVWETERDMIRLFKQRNAWEDFKVSEHANDLQSFTKAFYAVELKLKKALRHFIRALAANSC